MIPALLPLGGCASLSEGDCRSAAWSDIGFRDGRNGKPEDRIAEHTKACGKYAIEPDREAYFEGRDAGLPHYCTRLNGLNVGRAGGSYEGVCAPLNEREFLQGFTKGQELYRARERLDYLESEIGRIDEKRERDDIDEADRSVLTERRIELEGERGGAREVLQRLEWEAEEF